MFNLRIKTKVTFSFSKLNKKLTTLLPQTERRNLRDVANKWKQNIKGGTFLPLAPATQKRRKYKGYNPHYPRTKPINTKTPLIATGNLLKSIRVTRKGISFNKYGAYHVEGLRRPIGKMNPNLPKRNWMKGAVKSHAGSTPGRFGGTSILTEKNRKLLKKEIRKGFKLAGRGKNIRSLRF